MKKRKILSLFISAIMITGFISGCGGSISKNLREKITSDNQEIDKTPITLTFFNCDITEDMNFDDDVAKKIKELTGVTLEIKHPVAANTQSIPLMIACGEYPDLIYAKGDTSKLIDAGAIIKLDDYIDKQGNNIKALYGDQLNRLRYSLKDPSIYTVGTYGVNTEVWNPEGTLQIQHAVLKELGYPKIKTIYDYEKALKEYIAKYPEVNGQKTIGMSLMASDWRWLITCGNRASQTAGIADDGQFKVDDETQKAIYKFQLPEVKEYFKWLNKMNSEGLLDQESFTQTEDTYRKKLAQGNVLGIADSRWDYDEATRILLSSKMYERTYAPLPITISENDKCQSLKDYGFSGGWGVAIATTSPNKDRAFQFLNWLASDEAQVLLNWGVEGIHYKVDENGKRKFLPEVQRQKDIGKDFSKKTGIGRYTYPFPQRGDGVLDPTGNTYTPNSLQSFINSYNPAEKETLAAYGVKSWPELYPQREELKKSKHGQAWQLNLPSDSDMAIIKQRADDYIQKAVTEAILGSPENFDASWDEIQTKLKSMNIEKLNEDMSKLISDTIELWNK